MKGLLVSYKNDLYLYGGMPHTAFTAARALNATSFAYPDDESIFMKLCHGSGKWQSVSCLGAVPESRSRIHSGHAGLSTAHLCAASSREICSHCGDEAAFAKSVSLVSAAECDTACIRVDSSNKATNGVSFLGSLPRCGLQIMVSFQSASRYLTLALSRRLQQITCLVVEHLAVQTVHLAVCCKLHTSGSHTTSQLQVWSMVTHCSWWATCSRPTQRSDCSCLQPL